jgi:uncharacterized pyridoxamine 5'-phosphate oxidase family protein
MREYGIFMRRGRVFSNEDIFVFNLQAAIAAAEAKNPRVRYTAQLFENGRETYILNL